MYKINISLLYFVSVGYIFQMLSGVPCLVCFIHLLKNPLRSTTSFVCLWQRYKAESGLVHLSLGVLEPTAGIICRTDFDYAHFGTADGGNFRAFTLSTTVPPTTKPTKRPTSTVIVTTSKAAATSSAAPTTTKSETTSAAKTTEKPTTTAKPTTTTEATTTTQTTTTATTTTTAEPTTTTELTTSKPTTAAVTTAAETTTTPATTTPATTTPAASTAESETSAPSATTGVADTQTTARVEPEEATHVEFAFKDDYKTVVGDNSTAFVDKLRRQLAQILQIDEDRIKDLFVSPGKAFVSSTCTAPTMKLRLHRTWSKM